MIAAGNFLLRGTEASICQPDMLFREVCCLLGAHISGVTERPLSLVQPTDNYPQMLFHVGISDTARRSVRTIKKDYRALGVTVKNFRVPAVFLSVLSVKRKRFERVSRIW